MYNLPVPGPFQVPQTCYLQRYDDDCSAGPTQCLLGAKSCANSIVTDVNLPVGAILHMPPPPSDPLNDWEKEVLKLTDGRGVDVVVEVGGAGTLGKSYQAVGFGGKVALIGVLAGHAGETHPHPLMFKGASLHGIFVGSRSMFAEMLTAMTVNQIRPVVDRAFPFEQAADAYRYQMAGAHFGKVVIAV